VNFFRDVCPQLLPKKALGRDQKIEAPGEALEYGKVKLHYGVPDAELLGDNIGDKEILDDHDLKRIQRKKRRLLLAKYDKGFKSSSEEESSDEFDGEEGEAEQDEGQFEKDDNSEASGVVENYSDEFDGSEEGEDDMDDMMEEGEHDMDDMME